ncbi:LuxR C-terminal-related transcriptional regulator [Streptomyces sp. NPDC090025]|uniref:helix-turn-helix transcriptional regulator n=1 Tax=Streptomyces sp. NPDC090025 TaxID=3365922 RepID=UPI003838722C
MWRLYADLLLAKKLIELHVSQQVVRVVSDMRATVDGAGLLAFSSLPDALLATLDLQEGRYDDAIEKARTAVGLSDRHASAVGVKLALSVAAMAQLRKGRTDLAVDALTRFHRRSAYYAYPDSIARAAYAELVLTARQDGPRAAADQLRARWSELATTSGCLVEDPTRAAWMIATARAAGDVPLAERARLAIEKLARNNPGVPAIEAAARYARAAWLGDPPAPEGPRVPRQRLTTSFAPDAGAADADQLERLDSLTQREIEVARHVTYGLTNQQIARELELSPHTVNYHLRNIFRKLAITSRVKIGPVIALLDRGERR